MEEVKYTEVLAANRKSARQYNGTIPYRIKVLNNITCLQLGEFFKYHLYKSGIHACVDFGEYDNIVQDSDSCDGYDAVIVHYDILTVFEKRKEFIESLSDEEIQSLAQNIKDEWSFILNRLQKIPLLIFNSLVEHALYTNVVCRSRTEKLINKLNGFLYACQQTNLRIANIGIILSRSGLRNTFDTKLYVLSKTLYSGKFWMQYASEVVPLVCKIMGKLKKAIIFDCDNTLWKGILGEDGKDGIDMSISSPKGYYYNKVQQIAVWLSRQGVIIGLCSKNNPDDVDEILSRHKDMVLRDKDIVIKKVNWQDKVANLKRIAQDLNIGIESMIFVDDSDFEIQLVKEQLPDVLTFQVPANIIEYPDRLLSLINRWFLLDGNEADMDRTRQYKQDVARLEEKSNFSSIETYLKNLDIRVSITENEIQNLERLAQLTQKTNQFNVTTRRYTEVQVKEFMEKGFVWSVSVEDKFGDSGLTAEVICLKEKDEAILDSFIMSCRIMGRNIEKAVMNHLVETLVAQGTRKLRAQYIPSRKNPPVRELFDNLGFNLVREEKGIKDYELVLADYKKQNVEYIKIN